MRNAPVLGLVILVALAGCGTLFGGPQVVEDECVEVVRGVVSCDVVVENPEEDSMEINVTVQVGTGDRVFDSETEIIELDPGERENVSMALGGSGNIGYDVDVEAVTE